MPWHRQRRLAGPGPSRAGGGRLTSHARATPEGARQTARRAWAEAVSVRVGVRPRGFIQRGGLVEHAGFAQIPQVLDQPEIQVRFGAFGELAQQRSLANTL